MDREYVTLRDVALWRAGDYRGEAGRGIFVTADELPAIAERTVVEVGL